MHTKLTAEGERIAQLLATDPDLQALAAPAELAATRSDYGGYMRKLTHVGSMLGDISDNLAGEAGLRVAARSMQLAGGDSRGIYDALAILVGESLPMGVQA